MQEKFSFLELFDDVALAEGDRLYLKDCAVERVELSVAQKSLRVTLRPADGMNDALRERVESALRSGYALLQLELIIVGDAEELPRDGSAASAVDDGSMAAAGSDGTGAYALAEPFAQTEESDQPETVAQTEVFAPADEMAATAEESAREEQDELLGTAVDGELLAAETALSSAESLEIGETVVEQNGTLADTDAPFQPSQLSQMSEVLPQSTQSPESAQISADGQDVAEGDSAEQPKGASSMDDLELASMVSSYLGESAGGFDREQYLKEREAKEQEVIREKLRGNESAKKPAKLQSGETAVLLGKAIRGGHVIPIGEITAESGKVLFEGQICHTEEREIRGERVAFSFDVTDFDNSITVKRLFDQKGFDAIRERIRKGVCVRVRGDAMYDKYVRDLVITPYDVEQYQPEERMDTAEQKRVELHLHTQMSAMDGVSSVKDLVSRAAKWGHSAVAITDHGVVQAFPDAHLAAKKSGIKIIYGTECYLVNDGVPIVVGEDGRGLDESVVVFDIETTGLSAQNDTIIEIGAVRIRDGVVTEHYQSFVNPRREISQKIFELTGISNDTVKDARGLEEVLPEFLEFVGDCPVVAHNAGFDCGFMKVSAKRLGLSFDNTIIDTLEMARRLLPDLKRHRLDSLAQHFSVEQKNHHRADDDARVTAEIYLKLCAMLREKGVEQIDGVNVGLLGTFDYKKARSFHCIILVKNHEGLINLYKLISKSELEYFYKTPRILKSQLNQYRDGLIVGSACEAGELYRAILDGKDDFELSKLIRFYDYLEIQPLANNRFLIENGTVKSEEELRNINRRIIALGKKAGKPTVATGDVHFLDPRDEVFRRILMAGQGFRDADNQAPLYLKTTDEMLEEFSYLGEAVAREVVIENPNKIAESTDAIKPIPDETFPPEIEGAEEELIRLSEERAARIYGDQLPDIVKERMDRELHSITTYGFSVMYMIAQKLVKKSLDDGYLVGSRGSVGSSFIAFLSGITEVNALPAHYVCQKCKYSEFVPDGAGMSGCDLPDKDCPVCGTKLKKDGHDIPFETFLGFEGDKEPDIDLNFSGDYQPVAHKYTEELFGEGHVFRAGTIATIAEKTAYGFVKKYFEAKGEVRHTAEINRLVQGCTGVKRTTGQHPGGVMIVPRKNEIYEFCPIQRPADDVSTEIITTHFDYHSISGRLLKLDILGHDDPTVIRMLEDLTGVDAKTIPIDDKPTMSLFLSPDALHVAKEDIRSETGTYAVPEFGTKFVRQMLVDTKPTTFGELVRISGLSHGTDVWLNNAQELVRNGTCTLKDAICTRDDIMIYLLSCGLPKKMAFDIMEKVRKGKGVSEEYEKEMRACNVPDWYIDSCKKIKYMFPKAHAVAYVTMAFRIAWFKVHYPIEFYIAYFTVRADEFDYDLMGKGVEMVLQHLDAFEARGNDITAKERNVVTILEVCLEMYRRGISFLPVDIYESDATRFLKRGDQILPPLVALSGLGETAANSIVEEREKEPFFSKEDLLQRCKISKTVLELIKGTGCLDDMPDSSQLTLF